MKSRRQRQRDRNKKWFHQYEIEYFIREHFPACPEVAIFFFAHKICTAPKNWAGATIAEAVNLAMQNHLRHEFTDYDQSLMVGVRRKEARRRVQAKINAMIDSWLQRPNR